MKKTKENPEKRKDDKDNVKEDDGESALEAVRPKRPRQRRPSHQAR